MSENNLNNEDNQSSESMIPAIIEDGGLVVIEQHDTDGGAILRQNSIIMVNKNS